MVARAQLLVALLIILVVGLFGYLATLPNPNRPQRPAPDFAFGGGATGLPARLSNLQGKVVLLDFWATWCGPCRMSIPELEKLYQAHAKDGFQVIGIAVDDKDTQSAIPAARQALGITYPTLIRDQLSSEAMQYDTSSIPSLYLIDKSGNISFVMQGYDPKNDLEKKITDLLQE